MLEQLKHIKELEQRFNNSFEPYEKWRETLETLGPKIKAQLNELKGGDAKCEAILIDFHDLL